MIMCVLLCYPVSIHMSQLLSTGRPISSCKLKSVKSVSCVTQLSCVQPVTNVKNVVSNLPVGARLQNY